MSSKINTKICTKCNKEKHIYEYSSQRRYCKECGREMCRIYKANNRDKIAEYNKQYKQEHKDELSEYNSNYHQEHKERIYKRHSVNMVKYRKNKKENNDDRLKKIDKLKEGVRFYVIGRNKTNKYLGCSREFFMKWISFIDPSCSLENYGLGGWCMDHVIPSSKFSLENIDKCLHWSNVQPLSISKNSKKHKYLKREELDKHLKTLNTFIEENKELILKENIIIPEFDRYSYLDPSSV